MSRTIIITESQERYLRRFIKESEIASLKQDECTDFPEHVSMAQNGAAGSVAGRLRNIASTDAIADELTATDYTKNGRYSGGF